MSRAGTRLLAIAGAGLLAAGSLGCQTAGRTVVVPGGQPPLAEMVAPPSYLTPRSQRYRVAVLPFVDQTGRAGSVSDAAADVLVTALHGAGRFSLYDPGAAAPAKDAPAKDADDVAPADRYARLSDMVDGVLESHVTGIRVDDRGRGSFEVDYRMVDPHSRMVVTSGSATLGVQGGAIVRADVEALAAQIGSRFVAPERLAAREVSVRELSLDGADVQLTLDGGDGAEVRRGAVGFVVERDTYARVDRYLAKFVVVNVFPEAAVGVVVEHCNAVGRCAAGQAVAPVQQAQNVHIGSHVRFK